jgi:soluble lytic murein transglycosylase
MQRIFDYAKVRSSQRRSSSGTAVAALVLGLACAVGGGKGGVGNPAVAGLLVHAPDGREIASGIGIPADFAPKTDAVRGENASILLTDDDVRRYRLIFELQERGAFSEADDELRLLKDRRLVGYVYAHRYLLPGRKTAYADLADWLQRYADLADAERIHQLAVARQPSGGAAPRAPRGRGIKLNGSLEQLAGYRPAPAALADTAMAVEDGDGPVRIAPRSRSGARPSSPAQAQAEVDRALQAGKPSVALSLLMSDEVGGKLDPKQYDSSRSRVAAGLYYSGQVEEAQKLATATTGKASSASLQTHWIAGLSAWRLKRYAEATKHFEAIVAGRPDAPWFMAAGAFWAARGHRVAGDNDGAKPYLTAAALYPHTFYGLIATRALGQTPRLNWDMPRLTGDHLAALSAVPGGKRAAALLQVGRRESAERELLRIDPRGNRMLEEALLALADQGGLPVLALELGNAVLRSDGGAFDGALYPLPHWRPRDGFVVDRALMFAVMRQESRFDTTLVSGAGASGLMQLLPSTAKHVSARNADLADGGRSGLFNPATNLELGQRYLNELLATPDVANNLVLALAAYNAGPANALRWYKDLGRSRNDPFLFIESLPFAETRQYVERVMANYWLYRQRLGLGLATLDDLSDGRWPQYAAPVTQTAELAP